MVADTFFRSRWVTPPEGVKEIGPDELPRGFRAAGVACGIKRSGERDVGLLVCDGDPVSAARFTRNALVAAPVTVSRKAELARLCGVVVNSGNANVSNGEEGVRTAKAMVEAASSGLEVPVERVAVASTGVIGVGLSRERVLEGVKAALPRLAPSAADFAHAIMTTDRWPKYSSLEVSLSEGPVRLCAQAKGAGMMSPSFATLLCFVETDARIDAATLDRLLEAGLARSFERITVDGQLSTNDSVFMISGDGSGVSVTPGTGDEQLFAQALDALLRQLAIEVVADGEGSTRVARLEVRGGTGASEPVARAVADSPLVKCALFGGDPNWGRVLQAAGQVLPDAGPIAMDLWIEEIRLARASDAVSLSGDEERRLERAMQEPEIEMRLSFGGGEEEAEIFFCDLGHDYVSLNAEYMT